ncbi:MAG: hypothetical protein ACR2H1_00960, partial [Limisphaerales bacterium]
MTGHYEYEPFGELVSAAGIGGSGASQAIGILNRVRQTVDTYNYIQQMAADLETARENGASDEDIFLDLLTAGKDALVSGLKNKVVSAAVVG